MIEKDFLRRVMSKTRSVKAKGRRLQNLVRDKLRAAFPTLEEDDIKSQTMGMGGEDIVLSPSAKKVIPYSFECKNTERLNLWKSLEQCESNCKEGIAPAIVVKKNRKSPMVAIPLDVFLGLVGE